MVATGLANLVRKRILLYGLFGLILTVTGSLIIVVYPIVLKQAINSPMGYQIYEGNAITKGWKEAPIPMYSYIYIWNIDNPKQFLNGARPKLTQMGPYVYKKHQRKEIISWGPNNETVKFWTVASWQFDPDKTVGSRHDRITMINLPVYTMATMVKDLVVKLPFSIVASPVVFSALNLLFKTHHEGLLRQMSVGKFIEGYRFEVLDTLDILKKPLATFGIKLPDPHMPQNKFGILHIKNNTKGGPYEVYTGQAGTDFLKFKSYQNKRSLNYYKNPKCNQFNGTDGTSMGSFLTKQDVLYMFNGDVCRSIYAVYKEVSFVKGMPAWRFVLPRSLFASPTKNPANRCYCPTNAKNLDVCDGVLYLARCQSGAPLALSYPHLMYAGDLITKGVIGMNPDPVKHESYFDVEPTLGTPMRGAGRFQLNVIIKPTKQLTGFGSVRQAIVPFIWMEETAEVEGKYEWMMRGVVYSMLTIDYGSMLLMILGILMVTYSLYYAFQMRQYIFGSNPTKEFTIPTPISSVDNQKMYQNIYPDLNLSDNNNNNNNQDFVNNSLGSDLTIYSIDHKLVNNKLNEQTNLAQKVLTKNKNAIKISRITWTPPGSAE